MPPGPGRGLRATRRPSRGRDHRQAPPQPREAQLPGHRARPEGPDRGGLRGGQGDPEAREPPGAQLHRSRTRSTIAITPDVYVDQGRREVRRHRQRSRRAAPLHQRGAHQAACSRIPTAKEFIGEKLRNAQWLIRAIEQRRKTIIRVTECIVEKQREFFEKGVAYLKPMILRDVAEAVGMHESTISRVTTNKYVHTPQGLFELKYFFNSSHPPRRRRGHRLRERQAGDQEDHRRRGQGRTRSATRRSSRSSRRTRASRSRGAPSRSTARCSASSRRPSAKDCSRRLAWAASTTGRVRRPGVARGICQSCWWWWQCAPAGRSDEHQHHVPSHGVERSDQDATQPTSSRSCRSFLRQPMTAKVTLSIDQLEARRRGQNLERWRALGGATRRPRTCTPRSTRDGQARAADPRLEGRRAGRSARARESVRTRPRRWLQRRRARQALGSAAKPAEA